MKTARLGLRGRIRLPRRLKVTTEGKGFVLLTLGVGVAAINTGNNLLYIALSMNLSLIVLSGILSEWCIRGVSVQVIAASEAFASRESLLAVTCMASGKRFPAMSLTVVLSFGETALTARFPEIPAGGRATRVLSFIPRRRGALPGLSCVVSTRFPFALFEKSMDAPAETAILVYPEPSGAGEAGESRAVNGGAAAAGRQGSAIRGVREHMPADAVRDIHWKASARMGKWMVKERESEAAPVFDFRIPVSCRPDEFEPLISRACAFVLRCEKEGKPYRLWAGDRIGVDATGGGGRKRALAFLALVGSDGALPVNGRPS